jgi:hypothetical protein
MNAIFNDCPVAFIFSMGIEHVSGTLAEQLSPESNPVPQQLNTRHHVPCVRRPESAPLFPDTESKVLT